MKPIISLLLGSGFSIPEGVPRTLSLNNSLSKITESEIIIHGSQKAGLLRGEQNPNSRINWIERMFVQEFIEFYSAKESNNFNYEVFYDFYMGYLRNEKNKEAIEEFNHSFEVKHNLTGSSYSHDSKTNIRNFNRTFSQLLSDFLKSPKYYDDGEAHSYHYNSFINFIKETLLSYDIKIHSLNHDILFDWLGSKHPSLSEYFSDGFLLEGSPYYGNVYADFEDGITKQRIRKSYYAKLEQFANKFDKPLCLFKLHGSVSNKIVYTPLNNNVIIQPSEGNFGRIKDNYSVSDYYMELPDDKIPNRLSMRELMDRVEPDILTGKTEKMFQYDAGYYKLLFEHFKNNLTNSELLIVIGYGFQDDGINKRLEEYFLSKGKKMIVIDPFPPDTDLTRKYKPFPVPKSIEYVTAEDYSEIRRKYLTH